MPAIARHRQRRFRAAIRLGALLLAWTPPCLAQPGSEPRPERLLYGGDAHFPPHEYLDERGEPAGYNVDLIRLLARAAGVDVEVRLGEWNDLRAAHDRGDVDVMALAWSAARAERYAYIVQIWTLRQGLLFRQGRESYPQSLAELSGEVVAAERGGGVHERLLALPASRRPTIRPVLSHEEACLRLLHGEVTVAAGGQQTLRYYASRVGLTGVHEVIADSWGYYFATTPDKAARFAFLEREFERLRGSDDMNRIVERAFALPGPERTLGERGRELLPLIAGVLLVLGLAFAWNRTLRHQVEARTRELAESERRRVRNERLAALGNLVGAVAHEVRNPLFAISANVDVLEQQLGDPTRARVCMERLRGSCERMSQLMQELLDYGRPDALELARGPIQKAVDDAVAASRAIAAERGVDLVMVAEPDVPDVLFDRARLGRAFRNLIENAVQHAPRSGRVSVRLRRDGDATPAGVEIRVEDDGPGFAPESLERIFEPFFSTRDGGTGLGLAIAERVIEAHQGVIDATNSSNGGAVVRVRLRAA